MTVRITGLSKRYGATLALDGVSLEIAPGEVHALLGQNGAGKSTLIACLGGGVQPTAGTIEIDGTTVDGFDPRGSIAAGVAVIYQHLSLIDSLSVTDNLFLGQERSRAGLLNRAEQTRIAEQALARVGSVAHPDTLVGELSMGQRQLVEIAKALQRDARLLILDEPSAALSAAEAERLTQLVRDLKAQGLAILYVTHLLSEVMSLADETTVLRNGRVIWNARMSGVTKADLVDAISAGGGQEYREPTPVDPSAAPVFELEQYCGPSLGPIDLSIRPGEIVALFGLIGASRSRLLETVFGRRRHDSGVVRIDGRPVTVRTPRDALAGGIALVPGDRARQGLLGILPALDNVVVDAMSRLSRRGLRRLGAERSVFSDVADWMSLRPGTPELPAGRFSGGNQQKLLIGRWVNRASTTRVLLLDDPTQGVDVGARAEIYDVIRALAAERGLAVLLATNEPDEVLALSHRCLVMRKGRIVAELETARTGEEELLALIHHDTRAA